MNALKCLCTLATVTLLTTAFVGCSVSGSGGASSTNLKYTITENECPTGTHSFSSQSELCSALQSDSLNNNCAYSMRKEKFQNECPGNWSPTN
jgi:hypothetical protein